MEYSSLPDARLLVLPGVAVGLALASLAYGVVEPVPSAPSAGLATSFIAATFAGIHVYNTVVARAGKAWTATSRPRARQVAAPPSGTASLLAGVSSIITFGALGVALFNIVIIAVDFASGRSDGLEVGHQPPE